MYKLVVEMVGLLGADLSDLVYAFWSRGGPSEALARHPDVRAFTPADLLGL